MRGGAQAHLIEASDGHFYVVKFLSNPQHRRILVNEWIASTFLSYLGISTPEVAMVRVSQGFLDDSPEAYIQLRTRRRSLEPGLHFGSQFPGDPGRRIVYDFLPDSLLARVENLAQFRGALAFDKWVGNFDSRQAIFFRAPLIGAQALRLGFVAQMVDNGCAFEGQHWRLPDSAIQGVYFRPTVYSGVRGLDDFAPWLDRIVHFPEDVVDEAIKQIPDRWLEGEEKALATLLQRLMARCKRVPDLIQACRDARANPFPDWK